ncbi:MAG: hypothetical protein ACOH2R_06895 [Pseudomonas sp.]
MRINGTSSRSYPIKRKPRKGPATIDGAFEETESEIEAPVARAQTSQSSPTPNLPARQQDMVFPRSVSNRVAIALASYLSTASFVEWDMEVLGLDVHV